jgi:cellulose synthase/poly-beta-1,6-N-acetylglucosamine synthase-like glycosyltransferase
VLRGKGYALDFGLRWLSADPPDVLIVLDADCEIHGDGIPRLAERCLSSGRPIQSLYLMRSAGASSLRMRIAEFAWLVKNHLRPLGSARIGAPCQLTGTGMAFPWRLIASVSLANGHLVEDMKLGVDLAMQGTPPQFAPDVLVTSSFPTTAQGVASQRQRWEHGHLAMLGRELPRLIGAALIRRSPIAFALAADLLVPPLALLVLLLVLVLALGLVGLLAAGWTVPVAIAGTSLALLCVATLLAWSKHGRSVLTLSDLLSVPSYVLWKIPLYLRFVFNRQIDWIRTQRDGE